MSGTARLVGTRETESFFTGVPITKNHYEVNPPLDGNSNLVVSVVQESTVTGKPSLAVFRADSQGYETEYEALNEDPQNTDVEAALEALGYEVVSE